MSGTGRNNTVDLNVSNPVLKACIYSLFFCIDCKAACVDLRTIAYTGFGLIICIDNRECCTYSGTALSCAASRSLSTGLILLIKLCTGKSCSPCAGCQLALLCGFYFYIAVRVNNSTITDLSCSSCIGSDHCNCSRYCCASFLRTVSGSGNGLCPKLCNIVATHIVLCIRLNGYIAHFVICITQISCKGSQSFAVVYYDSCSQCDGRLFRHCRAGCQRFKIIKILSFDGNVLCLCYISGYLCSHIMRNDGYTYCCCH